MRRKNEICLAQNRRNKFSWRQRGKYIYSRVTEGHLDHKEECRKGNNFYVRLFPFLPQLLTHRFPQQGQGFNGGICSSRRLAQSSENKYFHGLLEQFCFGGKEGRSHRDNGMGFFSPVYTCLISESQSNLFIEHVKFMPFAEGRIAFYPSRDLGTETKNVPPEKSRRRAKTSKE